MCFSGRKRVRKELVGLGRVLRHSYAIYGVCVLLLVGGSVFFFFFFSPGAQTSMLALMGELRGMQMHVQELQLKLDEKDRRIGTLLREAQVMQAQCHEKIKVLVVTPCRRIHLSHTHTHLFFLNFRRQKANTRLL